MRVRTAHVTINKAIGIDAFFRHATDRHLAWAVGDGHVYADLEKVAAKNGYAFWVSDSDGGNWAVVRQDLLGDEDLDEGGDTVTFETTRRGLGPITLGDDSFGNNDPAVTVLDRSVEAEFNDYTYSEVLYSVAAPKD